MRKLIDPNSSCGFCGGYDLGTRCESCGAGRNYDATGGEQGWIMKNAKVEFGEGVVEGLANIGIDAEKEVRCGIVKARINELRLDAGIARIEKQQWLCVLDKETGMMIDPMIGLEKFAELIVRECLKKVEEEYKPVLEDTEMMKDTHWDGYVQCGVDSYVAIREHFFGVEE